MTRVLILVNAPASGQRWKNEATSDRAVEGMSASVAVALADRGFQVTTEKVGLSPREAIDAIEKAHPDLVFNFCETMCGNSRLEPAVPYLLGWLGIPYTGNPAGVLALLIDKVQTKRILRGLGLPTPDFLEARDEKDLNEWKSWPAILKPAAEDASLGIDSGSVVETPDAARERFHLLADRFGLPVLVEKFIAGRELNVAVLQTPSGLRLGINEIDFSALPGSHPKILTYEAKWAEDSDVCRLTPVKTPPNLTPTLSHEVRGLAQAAFEKLGLRGYARVDFRVDESEHPWILEINPNPDISEDAGFAKSLPQMGLAYPDAVEIIARAALPGNDSTSDRPKLFCSKHKQIAVRSLRADDRGPIENILRGTGFFHNEEVAVALELVDDALQKADQQDYFFGLADIGNALAGFVCYGQRPLTEATYDLYWVCVDASLHNRGIGKVLMEWAEERIQKRGCRAVIVETSGRPIYEPTREFYKRIGYLQEARIKDFYENGDDLVIYTKHFPDKAKRP